MFAAAAALAVATALTPSVELPSLFWGITPEVLTVDADTRLKPKQDRAVVLVHGLLPRVFQPDRAEKPEAHEWQVESGRLVKALADGADVYGFSYAQTRSVDEVVFCRGLRDGVAALKAAGYKEVVLVGHSAGSVVVRRFVEVFPSSGVTKVIAIAGPFGGSGWASLPSFTLPKTQVPFIASLTPEVRQAAVANGGSTLPKGLEFCCVICKVSRLDNDTVVALDSQWPEDLRKQGVPAVVVACNHFEAMTCEPMAKEVEKLVSGKVVRWDDEQTATAKRVLFGERK